MLEWYQPGDNYRQGMQLLADLAREVSGAANVETLTYEQVFSAVLPPRAAHGYGRNVASGCIASRATRAGFARTDRDGWLDFLLTERIQPQLGKPRRSFSVIIPRHKPHSRKRALKRRSVRSRRTL